MWLILTLACGAKTDSDSGADAIATDVDSNPCDVHWDGWANGFFSTYCRSCHSSTSEQRHDAPMGVDFDTQADIEMWLERIEVRVLDEETMPLGGGIPEIDLERFATWMDCQENP
ncbi:MAG: hypothetical protein CL930_07820 [Deltaproteobacteria bacterium]|nr:hypothetical protein [Deltaproteobacteria bacterium]